MTKILVPFESIIRGSAVLIPILAIRESPSTVELRSKGPGRKGNPPIRENISSPNSPYNFYIGYKGISVYRKN